MAGLARRRTTVSRMRSSPQPSTRAASEYSSGMVRKNWRSRKIENASPNQLGMIERGQRADEVQLGPHDVERHRRHLRGQHHRRQHEQEDRVAPAPAQPGERVGDGDARDQHADRRQPRVDHRVQRVAPERGLVEDLGDVAPVKRLRPELGGERLVVRHQGRQEHEGEGREEHDRQRDEDAVVGDRDQGAAAAHRARWAPADECRGRRGPRGHLERHAGGAHQRIPAW